MSTRRSPFDAQSAAASADGSVELPSQVFSCAPAREQTHEELCICPLRVRFQCCPRLVSRTQRHMQMQLQMHMIDERACAAAAAKCGPDRQVTAAAAPPVSLQVASRPVNACSECKPRERYEQHVEHKCE